MSERPAEDTPAVGEPSPFASVPDDANITIRREPPDERQHRQQKEDRDQQHQQRQEIRNWWAALISGGAVAVICVGLAFPAGADLRKDVLHVLQSLFTAVLGYLAGRGAKPAEK